MISYWKKLKAFEVNYLQNIELNSLQVFDDRYVKAKIRT